MSSISIINQIKYNPIIFKIVKILGEIALSLLRLFIQTDDKLILFVCFGGRKYDDSPRCIYEAMLKDERYDECKFVWAFIEPEKHVLLGRGVKIKIDTLKYFITCFRARVWITNSAVTRGLSFKGKRTFYFNTWHGSAIKRLGNDMNINSFGNFSKEKEKKTCLFDVFCAQSEYDINIFSSCFSIPKDCFEVIGLPRNDELVINNNESTITNIKNKLKIPLEKKVILYAPTFREYDRDYGNNCVLVPPMNLEKWKKVLGGDYVLLFRAHYEVVKTMDIEDNTFIRNVSKYPNINELMLISDILLSDYSSIYFDYSILGRPMICWAYDFELYNQKRGLYFDIRNVLGDTKVVTEDDVLDTILNEKGNRREIISKAFRDEYVKSYGSASLQSLDIIYKKCYQ